LDTQTFQEHIRHTFDAYCKKVLKYAARDIYRQLARQAGREIPLSELPDGGADILNVVDEYFVDEKQFTVMGFNISVKDELLTEALRLLPERQRDIILRYYFLGLNDREVGEATDTAVRTVAYQRSAALKKLKEVMEDLNNDEETT
jgi:RNA polymerase sigma factor (sigma-70 family)